MIRTMQLEMNESRSIGAALYCTSDSVKQATRQTRVLTSVENARVAGLLIAIYRYI